jgi:hypothetical protein
MNADLKSTWIFTYYLKNKIILYYVQIKDEHMNSGLLISILLDPV